jgi:hypothetical protein
MRVERFDDEDEFDDLDDEEEFEDEGPDLGPDERDADLLDGTWELRYYTQQERPRDWRSIYVGIAILVSVALLLPALLAVFR